VSANTETFDAIVIGGGPGSISAAAYLRRAGRSALLLEKEIAPPLSHRRAVVASQPNLAPRTGRAARCPRGRIPAQDRRAVLSSSQNMGNTSVSEHR